MVTFIHRTWHFCPPYGRFNRMLELLAPACDELPLDKPIWVSYLILMWSRARIGVLVLLIAFAVGTAVHAAGAAAMVAKMALNDSSDMMGVNCEACEQSGEEEVMPTCNIVCITSLTAILVKEADLDVHFTHQEPSNVSSKLIGRSGHKDPDPPRSLS